MKFLKQSTAAVVAFGPALLPADGVTLVTSLVSALDHGTTGIFLCKNGAAAAIRHATVTATTYDAYGGYLVTLDTTDTNTLGRLRVMFAAAASTLPIWEDFTVISANVYDSLIAASANLQVDTTKVNGTAQTARDLGLSVLLSSGTGTGQLDFTSGVVKSNLAQILGTALTETAGLLAGGFKQFFNIASPTSTMNVVTAVTTATNLTTNNDKTGYGLSAAAVQAIWDALTSALTTVGSIGKLIVTNLDAAITTRTKPADTQAAVTLVATTTNVANPDPNVALIKAKTDNLPAAPAAVGDIPTAIQNADALLKRDWTSVTGEAARSVLNALRFLRNKWSVTAGTLTVTKEDDTTSAWTAAISTDAAAVPVTGSDPA